MKKKTENTAKAEKPRKELQFVTFKVPGFEDGTPLAYRVPFDLRHGHPDHQAILHATRKTPDGVTLSAEIPIVPGAIAANVRTRMVAVSDAVGMVLRAGMDCAGRSPSISLYGSKEDIHVRPLRE